MVVGLATRISWGQLTPLDIFCLFWDAKTKTVRGVNGSGRAPKALTLDYLRSQGINGDTVGSALCEPRF